ncbi:MAG: AMP-binding protein [Rhodobacter sp.]|nr:AMP-binding protein [Rhodobacter sp.]
MRGLWQSYSWTQYYERARAVGLSLRELGVQRGEVIAVLAENRPEWLCSPTSARRRWALWAAGLPDLVGRAVAIHLAGPGLPGADRREPGTAGQGAVDPRRVPRALRIVVIEREGCAS